MSLNLFKLYGSVIGAVSLIFGIVLLLFKRLDTILADKETTPKEIKSKRIAIAIVAIIGGTMSISAALFGWPPIKGYLIPPK